MPAHSESLGQWWAHLQASCWPVNSSTEEIFALSLKYLQRVLQPWIIKLGRVGFNFCPLFSCLVRFGDVKEEELRRHDGAGSDGYLAHIFRHAAKELFNEDVGEVTYRALR